MFWLSILPASITILLAVTTKRILPSILIGLLSGGFLKARGILSGVEVTIDYIVKNLSDQNNLYVLTFLYLFSALVLLIRRSGGIAAFTSTMDHFIKGKRGVFYALWALIPVTFIDCGFRVVAAGSILRSLSEKQSISRERMAFMLNNTASPAIELIPIATTFVAYNMGIIQQGLTAAGVKNESAYGVLLSSIPFQFFSWVVLVLTFSSIFMGWRNPSATHAKKNNEHEGMEMPMREWEPEIKPKILNLVMPLVLVIGLSIGLLAVSGFKEAQKTSEISEIIEAMEPGKTMLVALFLSLIATSALYLLQGYSLKKISSDVIEGGNNIMPTLAILILAWPLSKVSQDLGLGELVRETLGGSFPTYFIPLTAFLVTSLITYFIGSSWGAEALVMPVAIPLAVSGGASIALVAAAVISGGSYGDVTSPVSGMTNMAANITHADHAKYVKRAFFYNTIAATVAAVLFLVTAYFFNPR